LNIHHPSIFCLFETHGLFSKVERLWTSLGYSAIFIQEARGHSGGIWVLSCRQDLTFTLISSMVQSITFSISKGMAKWACSAIYASPTYTARIELWTHLQNLRNNIFIPWLMIGDFNEVKSIVEVSGCSFNYSRANIFRDMSTHCNMMDLDTEGGIFTWRRSTIHGVHMRKRLDRCMVDVDWRMSFPHALVELLAPHDSDHNPILLSCSKFRSIKSNLFHFQAAWISHPEYERVVLNSWTFSPGSALHKLKKVQDHSIIFNKEVFGNIFRNKRAIEARLKGVHQQLDIYQTSDLIFFERQLQQDYNVLLAQEEMLWYQKSRENWVKYGNRNTKFFHTQSVIRRRRNKISGLNIEGVWCTDVETLKREASKFFKQLFQSNDPCHPHGLNLVQIPQIGQELYDILLQPVLLEEVKVAIFSMESYKSPGPDGFQPIFFKTYWNIVGKDVWHLVSEAFSTGVIDPKLAETLIVPIPKVDVPSTLKDFRPISLCNVLLKTISKVLVSRIRPFLDKFVGPLQSSFIPKRGTADNAIIAQEIVHYMYKKKGKKGCLLFKIDFEKAYDRVD
jgi:hypothetical protein